MLSTAHSTRSSIPLSPPTHIHVDNKGTHRALKRFDVFARKVSKNYTRTVWILKCDIRKFFASIDHLILIQILEKRIGDKDILALLKNVIDSFHAENIKLTTKNCITGLPLGNLTSQLLVNIFMNEFDQWVKHVLKAKYYIRYADDFVFMSGNRKVMEEASQKSEAFLTYQLKLSLRPDKVCISTLASGIDFLGWVHFQHHKVLRAVTKKRMMRKVNEKNVTSYLGLLKHGNTWKIRESILSESKIATDSTSDILS